MITSGLPRTSCKAQVAQRRRDVRICLYCAQAHVKGSAGKPPLRQAAIPLAAMQDDSVVVRMPYRESVTRKRCEIDKRIEEERAK